MGEGPEPDVCGRCGIDWAYSIDAKDCRCLCHEEPCGLWVELCPEDPEVGLRHCHLGIRPSRGTCSAFKRKAAEDA